MKQLAIAFVVALIVGMTLSFNWIQKNVRYAGKPRRGRGEANAKGAAAQRVAAEKRRAKKRIQAQNVAAEMRQTEKRREEKRVAARKAATEKRRAEKQAAAKDQAGSSEQL